MARTEKVIMTNMCKVFSENRVLVQDKRDDDYSGITFPGGHVERGESFTDAVIREVWEETGLKISEPKLCGIKDWMINVNIFIIFTTCNCNIHNTKSFFF